MIISPINLCISPRNSQDKQDISVLLPLKGLPSADINIHLLSEAVFGRDVHVCHRLSAPYIATTSRSSSSSSSSTATALPDVSTRKRKSDAKASKHEGAAAKVKPPAATTVIAGATPRAAAAAATATASSHQATVGPSPAAAAAPVAAPVWLPGATTLKDPSRYASAVAPSVKRLRAPATASAGGLREPNVSQQQQPPPPPPSQPQQVAAAINNNKHAARPIVDLSAVFADLF